MATVPYSPVPSVAPQLAPQPMARVDAPVAAFGGATAAAISNLGRTVEGSSNELFARAIALQQLNNEAEANQAVANYDIAAGKIHAEYSALQGKAAADAYPKYQSDLESTRQNIRSGISNPMAAKMFDGPSLSMMGRTVFNGAGHAAQENKNYIVGTSKSRVDLAKTNAGANWNNDPAFEQNLQTIRDQVEFQGNMHGWSPVQVQAETVKQVGEATYKKLESQAITDPFGARRAYEANKDGVGPYRAQTEVMLERAEAGVGSRIIAHSISSGSYFDRVIDQESGGNIFSKASTSSAAGLAGFTKGTWDSVRQAHPELNLPATVDGANGQQQMDALKAFTKDNQAYLAKNGIEATGRNSYMAHFLGPAGAVKFISGMKADPGQPATNLVGGDVVAANRSVFLKPDGTPRTAAEVFMRQTARFAGPGELTRDSPSTWLSAAETTAAQVAKEVAPENPSLADAAIARVRQQYDLVHQGAIQADQYGQNMLEQELLKWDPSKGDPMDMIMSNPILAQTYNNLPGGRQKTISSFARTLSTRDIPYTPQRQALFNQVWGAMQNPATRAKAMDLDIGSLDLPQKQKNLLSNEKTKIIGGMQTSIRLQGAISLARPYMKSLNITAGSDDENEFIGALSQKLTDYEAQHKSYPDEKTIRDMASDLAAYHGGWFSGNYGYQPTSDFTDEIKPLYKSKYGTDPDPGKIAMMYQYSLRHPNWREELK